MNSCPVVCFIFVRFLEKNDEFDGVLLFQYLFDLLKKKFKKLNIQESLAKHPNVLYLLVGVVFFRDLEFEINGEFEEDFEIFVVSLFDDKFVDV